MSINAFYLAYLLPVIGFAAAYALRRRREESRVLATLVDNRDAGLVEPASLHPVIDPLKCLGCGSCVTACPEQPHHRVLGLINGKAQLVSPADCIGHGACRAACPMDAITLVFGTEARGVTLPLVSSQFETSVPGLYVAGEIGGMGLIRNALTQGRQAVEGIAKARRPKPDGALDLLVVGSGPAGFSAALAAKAHGLSYRVLEQDSLGGSVFQYPRGKLVMTQPAVLPIVGEVRLTTTSKEALLEFWQGVEKEQELCISYQEHVSAIERTEQGVFRVTSSSGEFVAAQVLLAIGRRGTPRKLGVPGEDLPKVVYRLIDPDQYLGRHVLVVGGGDSALEAAASVAEAGAAAVTLSYRGEAFGRAKKRNRERVEAAMRSGILKALMKSNVIEITTGSVRIDHAGHELELPNDDVIVNAGGVLPTEFLRSIGIVVETKYGTA